MSSDDFADESHLPSSDEKYIKDETTIGFQDMTYESNSDVETSVSNDSTEEQSATQDKNLVPLQSETETTDSFEKQLSTQDENVDSLHSDNEKIDSTEKQSSTQDENVDYLHSDNEKIDSTEKQSSTQDENVDYLHSDNEKIDSTEKQLSTQDENVGSLCSDSEETALTVQNSPSIEDKTGLSPQPESEKTESADKQSAIEDERVASLHSESEQSGSDNHGVIEVPVTDEETPLNTTDENSEFDVVSEEQAMLDNVKNDYSVSESTQSDDTMKTESDKQGLVVDSERVSPPILESNHNKVEENNVSSDKKQPFTSVAEFEDDSLKPALSNNVESSEVSSNNGSYQVSSSEEQDVSIVDLIDENDKTSDHQSSASSIVDIVLTEAEPLLAVNTSPALVDPNALHDIARYSSRLGQALDLLVSQLTQQLHNMSMLTTGCVQVHRDIGMRTAECVDDTLRVMYALIAKLQALDQAIVPVYELGQQISDLKSSLVTLDQLCR